MDWDVLCPACGGPAVVVLDWRGDEYVRCDDFRPCLDVSSGDEREIEAECRRRERFGHWALTAPWPVTVRFANGPNATFFRMLA